MHVSRRPQSSPAAPSSTNPVHHRYSDRFIPHRAGSGDLQAAFELLHRPFPPFSENLSSLSNAPADRTPPSPTSPAARHAQTCYSVLLKSELLDTPPPPPLPSSQPAAAASTLHLDARAAAKRRAIAGSSAVRIHPGLERLKRASAPSTPHAAPPNIFRFSSRPATHPSHADAPAPFCMPTSDTRRALLSASLSPGCSSRKIARAPFKVLDAPCLKDDFYLNLVDWSAKNVLAVGLGPCVYLWSACTSVVTKLCDLQFGGPICSVAWSQHGAELAVGTMPGTVQVWDTATGKLLRTMSGHTARTGCLAWNSRVLSSGSRDKDIYNRDMRCREPYVAKLSGHKQEVCGLEWSYDDSQLASGGNDNKLLVWNATGLGSGGGNVASGSSVRYNSPVLRFSYHDAAVKAIAWSPHTRGLLCSGGGTADRKIRFWNTMTSSALAAVDTGSQVCNLMWSKNVNEVVSTHGYSQNQIIVWKYPTLSKVVTLMGHSCRVLYLAMSPSGETIVTGAGDETLRFWNVFPSAKHKRGSGDRTSALSPSRMCIR